MIFPQFKFFSKKNLYIFDGHRKIGRRGGINLSNNQIKESTLFLFPFQKLNNNNKKGCLLQL